MSVPTPSRISQRSWLTLLAWQLSAVIVQTVLCPIAEAPKQFCLGLLHVYFLRQKCEPPGNDMFWALFIIHFAVDWHQRIVRDGALVPGVFLNSLRASLENYYRRYWVACTVCLILEPSGSVCYRPRTAACFATWTCPHAWVVRCATMKYVCGHPCLRVL